MIAKRTNWKRTKAYYFCPNGWYYLSDSIMSIPKTYAEFEKSLEAEGPPVLWPEALQALWWDARGQWENSHAIAQDIPSKTGNWIHAYLHRKEGDEWNARYWYERAGQPFPRYSLSDELRDLVSWVLEHKK